MWRYCFSVRLFYYKIRTKKAPQQGGANNLRNQFYKTTASCLFHKTEQQFESSKKREKNLIFFKVFYNPLI